MTKDLKPPATSADIKDLVLNGNVRKIIDEESIKELSENIKQHGVIQPLTCRKIANDKIEVVCGQRRYKAAKMAGLISVPIYIRDIPDNEVEDVQFMENYNREQMNPMDESDAVSKFYKKYKNYEVVCQKLNMKMTKCISYHSLQNLIEQGKKLVRENRIPLGHAMLISKLQVKDQPRALDSVFSGSGQDKKLIGVDDATPYNKLKGWIQNELMQNLVKAPFSKTDEKLVPEAGSCAVCPKRTGFNTNLFNDFDKKEDRCTDGKCFGDKMKAHMKKLEDEVKKQAAATIEANKNKKPEQKVEVQEQLLKITPYYSSEKGVLSSQSFHVVDKGSCPHCKVAIYVDGSSVGQKTFVCITKDCPVHGSKQPKDKRQVEVDEKKKYTDKVDALTTLELLKQSKDAKIDYNSPAIKKMFTYMLLERIDSNKHRKLVQVFDLYDKDKFAELCKKSQYNALGKIMSDMDAKTFGNMWKYLLAFYLIEPYRTYNDNLNVDDFMKLGGMKWETAEKKVVAELAKQVKPKEKAKVKPVTKKAAAKK